MPGDAVVIPTSADGLAKVRGWLLLFVVILIPHGVSAVVGLFSAELRSAAHIGGWGLVVLVITAVGNLGGILLILSRNRIAPAFMTLYPPTLLAINLIDPHLLTTVNARLAAFGSTGGLTAVQLAALLVVNAGIVALMVGYFSRSRRVKAVFGTAGLELLRSRRRGE